MIMQNVTKYYMVTNCFIRDCVRVKITTTYSKGQILSLFCQIKTWPRAIMLREPEKCEWKRVVYVNTRRRSSSLDHNTGARF